MTREDVGLVTTERDGATYHGAWSVKKGMITVTLIRGGSKSTQLGGSASTPESLARIMLGELIDERTRTQTR
jgi:hypothetical protein